MDKPAYQKIRVLWIEDGARVELPQLTTPVYMSSKHYLVVSENATDALRMLNMQIFDAVIFDLRIPPGSDEQFQKFYKNLAVQKKAQRLGLYILLSFFGNKEDNRRLDLVKPDWLTIERVAVLSVDPYDEPEVKEVLLSIALPVESYRQKTASMKRTTVVELVNEVLERSRNNI